MSTRITKKRERAATAHRPKQSPRPETLATRLNEEHANFQKAIQAQMSAQAAIVRVAGNTVKNTGNVSYAEPSLRKSSKRTKVAPESVTEQQSRNVSPGDGISILKRPTMVTTQRFALVHRESE